MDAEGLIDFRSLGYFGSLMLRIVQSSSWDVIKPSQRVLNFDESGLGARQCALG